MIQGGSGPLLCANATTCTLPCIWAAVIGILRSVPTTPMNFWTPERCKSIDTLKLMDNSLEMTSQAVVTNSSERKYRLLAIVEMIQAELRSRV